MNVSNYEYIHNNMYEEYLKEVINCGYRPLGELINQEKNNTIKKEA